MWTHDSLSISDTEALWFFAYLTLQFAVDVPLAVSVYEALYTGFEAMSLLQWYAQYKIMYCYEHYDYSLLPIIIHDSNLDGVSKSKRSSVRSRLAPVLEDNEYEPI